MITGDLHGKKILFLAWRFYEYPEKIKGIKKPNGGYGSVLQVALKEIKTPYFLVCDPDDWLEETAIEELYNLGFKGKFKSLSFKDEFIPHGKVDLLYSDYGLDSTAIKNTVVKMIK